MRINYIEHSSGELPKSGTFTAGMKFITSDLSEGLSSKKTILSNPMFNSFFVLIYSYISFPSLLRYVTKSLIFSVFLLSFKKFKTIFSSFLRQLLIDIRLVLTFEVD